MNQKGESMKQNCDEQSSERLHINFVLQGEEVTRFFKYKAASFLRNNSEAGRKLMLERLSQLEKEEAELATA